MVYSLLCWNITTQKFRDNKAVLNKEKVISCQWDCYTKSEPPFPQTANNLSEKCSLTVQQCT